ncbi:MAG: M55 family metallopeptidase [Rhizomicrobium sp.]
MRVYISADIEGIAAVTSREETGTVGFDFHRARERMTGEVLAAIAGARANGATGFVVSDSHGSGLNLIPERFAEDTELVRSWPRPLGMMQGIESGTFACAFLLGYHAGAASPGGTLAHTLSSRGLHALKINGLDLSEAGLSAAVAGQFGVPITLMSGDDVFIAETARLLGGLESVVTKRSTGYFSVHSKTPMLVERELRAAAGAALRRSTDTKPFSPEPPFHAEVTFKAPLAAELFCYLPGFVRVGACGVRFDAKDAVTLNRIMQFLTTLAPTLG